MNWFLRSVILWVINFYAMFYIYHYHRESWWMLPTEIILALFLIVFAIAIIDRCDKESRQDEEAKSKKEVNDEEPS